MEAVNLNIETLNLYHWAVLAGVICSLVGAWFVTKHVQAGHEVRLTKVEAKHEVLTEAISAHRLVVSETYARKDEVREGLRDVKETVEGMQKNVIDAIVRNGSHGRTGR